MKKIILSFSLLFKIISLNGSEELLESCSLHSVISELSLDSHVNHIPKKFCWDSFSFYLNKRDISGLTSMLQQAIDENNQPILFNFLRVEASDYIVQGYNALDIAVLNADIDLTKLALKIKVPVEAKNRCRCVQGNTALHCVSGHDDFQNNPTERSNYNVEDRLVIAQMLLDAGANVNALNRYGITPLRNAIDVHNIGMIEFLLKNGANANLYYDGYHHNNALVAAVRLNSLPIVTLLLQCGANPYIAANADWYFFKEDFETISPAMKALVALYARNLIPCTKEDARWHKVIAKIDRWCKGL